MNMIPRSICSSMVSSHPRDHAQQVRSSHQQALHEAHSAPKNNLGAMRYSSVGAVCAFITGAILHNLQANSRYFFRRPTRLSKNHFSGAPLPAGGSWRDQILVLKTAGWLFCLARGQWSAPNAWILPILCTRANNLHCTSTFNLDRSVKRFMRLCTQMLAKTGSTIPSRLA